MNGTLRRFYGSVLLCTCVLLAELSWASSQGPVPLQSSERFNRLRHLVLDWPVSQVKQENSEKESAETAGDADVESKRREIHFQIQSMLRQVSNSSNEDCRKSVKLAVASLESDWRSLSADIFHCARGCLAEIETLRRFQTELDNFAKEISDCSESAEDRLWWMSQDSGFGFGVFSQFEREDNTNFILPSEKVAGSELSLGGSASGTLRTESSWHSTENTVSFVTPSVLLNSFDFKHNQVHGLSTIGTGEYRVGFELSREHQWLRGQVDPRRIRKSIIGYTSGGRWMMGAGRALEVDGAFGSESWNEVQATQLAATPVWNHQEYRVGLSYPLIAGFDHSTNLKFEWEQHSFPDVDEQPIVRSLLLAYEAEKRFSKSNGIRVKIGLRDWRSESIGARLWPEARIEIKAQSSSHPSFHFRQAFLMEPEQQPWSSFALRTVYVSEVSWKKFGWEIPFEMEAGRVRNRTLPGGKRSDTLLGVKLAPAYSFNAHLRLSAEVAYDRMWIPDDRSVDAAVLYPQRSFQNLSFGGKVQYDF